MTKTSMLLCTGVAALSLANGAFAQSERVPWGRCWSTRCKGNGSSFWRKRQAGLAF